MEENQELQNALEHYEAEQVRTKNELDKLQAQLDSVIKRKNAEIAAKQTRLDEINEVITKLSM